MTLKEKLEQHRVKATEHILEKMKSMTKEQKHAFLKGISLALKYAEEFCDIRNGWQRQHIYKLIHFLP